MSKASILHNISLKLLTTIHSSIKHFLKIYFVLDTKEELHCATNSHYHKLIDVTRLNVIPHSRVLQLMNNKEAIGLMAQLSM